MDDRETPMSRVLGPIVGGIVGASLVLLLGAGQPQRALEVDELRARRVVVQDGGKWVVVGQAWPGGAIGVYQGEGGTPSDEIKAVNAPIIDAAALSSVTIKTTDLESGYVTTEHLTIKDPKSGSQMFLGELGGAFGVHLARADNICASITATPNGGALTVFDKEGMPRMEVAPDPTQPTTFRATLFGVTGKPQVGLSCSAEAGGLSVGRGDGTPFFAVANDPPASRAWLFLGDGQQPHRRSVTIACSPTDSSIKIFDANKSCVAFLGTRRNYGGYGAMFDAAGKLTQLLGEAPPPDALTEEPKP